MCLASQEGGPGLLVAVWRGWDAVGLKISHTVSGATFVSAAGIATGVGIAGAATANTMMHAAGDDHVASLKTNSGGGQTGGANSGPGQAITRENLSPSQQAT